MISRLNFLFAVAMSTTLVLYVVGRHVLLNLLALVAPGWTPWFAGALTLVAFMLIVLVLAQTVSRLGSLSQGARAPTTSRRPLLAQATLVLAHICVLGLIHAIFDNTVADTHRWLLWAVTPLLYAAGLALSISDWKARTGPGS